MIQIVVVDGQGGGLGKSIIEKLRTQVKDIHIIAVGTNSFATANMLKGGADVGVTGENAAIYNANHAQIILGPTGIVLANSMYGELTPDIARAIGESRAKKILIPISKCNTYIAGTRDLSPTQYVDDAVEAVKEHIRVLVGG